mmetsp:Transcript_4702/g.13828  ORF Transcript_4702/g.13828 Transcript_4702/m.13828 type:complete len:238 (-) Transcript_4702:10-723(-)
MAAFVFAPQPSPSQKPPPIATIGLSAAQSSTPVASITTLTRNHGRLNTRCHTGPSSAVRTPSVASQKLPAATSAAMFAPISTETSRPSRSRLMRSVTSAGRPSTTSSPLTSEHTRQFAAPPTRILRKISPCRNSCGTAMITSVASESAAERSASATTASGILTPGRYFVFSCCSLIVAASAASCTQSFTSGSNSGQRSVFSETSLATVVPHEPPPTTQTRCTSLLLIGMNVPELEDI